MNSYRLNPFVHIIENHIFPNVVQYGVFHLLTGEVIEPLPEVRSLLFALRMGSRFSIDDQQLESMVGSGQQIKKLIEKEFLLTAEQDPLASFLGRFATRPRQNPAVSYRNDSGDSVLVRTSMAQRIFSPAADELPKVIEEKLSPGAAALFLAADGSKTLEEIFRESFNADGTDPLAHQEFRTAIEYLTRPHRQLLKFTTDRHDIGNPFLPCNLVPRNMYLSKKTPANSADVFEFHRVGIESASQEFDFIEPTINHALRFPNEACGGLSYGARFCIAALSDEVLPLLSNVDCLEILEVGGGTGSFSASFIQTAQQLRKANGRKDPINYHIVDLSSSLIESQQKQLASVGATLRHFQQDATKLDLPDHKFDLIVSNEVIADFPVASVNRAEGEWQGMGKAYLDKYDLADDQSPDSFLINTGAIDFLERAWEHLSPGGSVILSEYGTENSYPVQAYHLNHEEFSIHFGHLKKCAEQTGFVCSLMKLKDFLKIDDSVLMLDGQEEQIMCLNHVFKRFGLALPFAQMTQEEYEKTFGELASRMELTGVSFSPLSNGFHFGPKLDQFMVLVMTRLK